LFGEYRADVDCAVRDYLHLQTKDRQTDTESSRTRFRGDRNDCGKPPFQSGSTAWIPSMHS
jgi:hypothetical protein